MWVRSSIVDRTRRVAVGLSGSGSNPSLVSVSVAVPVAVVEELESLAPGGSCASVMRWSSGRFKLASGCVAILADY